MLLRKTAVVGLTVLQGQAKKHREYSVAGRPFWSLSYRTCGAVRIRTDGGEFVSVPNTVTFVPRGCSYCTEVIEDTRMIALHFVLAEPVGYEEPFVLSVHDREIRSYFEKLERISQGNEEISFEGMAVFYQLLDALTRIGDRMDGTEMPRRLLQARALLEENFSDPLLSMEWVAAQVGVSSSYLRREFRQNFGVGPHGLLLRIRIRSARQLLMGTELPIAEIASSCGFSSACYFIQCFHKEVGVSPGEFRRQQPKEGLL